MNPMHRGTDRLIIESAQIRVASFPEILGANNRAAGEPEVGRYPFGIQL